MVTNENETKDTRNPKPNFNIWTPQETASNLAQFKNQYIRVNIPGMGWVVAQLLGTEPGGVVTLNVYQHGNPVPQFMKINQADLTGLTPLGFTPPPEIFTPAPTQPMSPSTMPPNPMQGQLNPLVGGILGGLMGGGLGGLMGGGGPGTYGGPPGYGGPGYGGQPGQYPYPPYGYPKRGDIVFVPVIWP